MSTKPKAEGAHELIANLDRLHTTPLGEKRIKENLSLDEGTDVVAWCRDKIGSPQSVTRRWGKNWYVTVDGCEITVNARSVTIITAHRVKGGGYPR